MDDAAKRNGGAHRSGAKGAGVYDSAEDALKELFEAFNYWSSQVTTTSVQMCYALIGANWVVFTSVGKILQNAWAIASLTTVMLVLALNMVSSLGFAEWMRRRFDKADEDRSGWAAEFEREKGKHGVWPYSESLERASIVLRYVKVLLPLASGLMLIIGAFSQK
jgi:hypothetical protein